MYNVTVLLTKTATQLPTGVTFAKTVLTVTDAQNVVQTFSLTGVETPPWSQAVSNLADGVSSFSAQDTDANSAAIGAAVITTYTPGAATFPMTSAITVTPA